MNGFSKREIMKKAWEFFKTINNFSECLKMAWRNAKAIKNALANIKEECHTWYAWKMLGYEVIHESKALMQVEVEDNNTTKGTRILSYFGFSQVAPLGE